MTINELFKQFVPNDTEVFIHSRKACVNKDYDAMNIGIFSNDYRDTRANGSIRDMLDKFGDNEVYLWRFSYAGMCVTIDDME